MKSGLLLGLLIVAVALSVFLTYQRSFTWKNFELINSEEEMEEAPTDAETEEELPAEESEDASTEEPSEMEA